MKTANAFEAGSRSGLRVSIMLLAFVVVCGQVAPAQRSPARGGFEVKSVVLEGNDGLTTRELRALLQTKETPGWFNKFLYSLGQRLGRPNEYFDPAIFAEDMSRVRQYYRDHGFLDVRVDSALGFSTEDTTVDISVTIEEGYRARIDSLAYGGLRDAPSVVFEELAGGEKVKVGEAFNKVFLEEEVRRVLGILNNTGYPDAGFVREKSSAIRYLSTGNYRVVLEFRLGRRQFFGEVATHQEGDSLRTDITDDVVIAQLDYRPHDIFSSDSWKSSERNLNRLGIFDLARVDTLRPNRDTSFYVPTLVSFRPRDRHEVAPEISLSDEDRNLNLGVGLVYTARNFFGGARTFSTHVRYRTQTLSQLTNSFTPTSEAIANADLTFELLQPYIFTNKVKGTWAFSVILDKQKAYLQRIYRNKFGFTDRFAEFTTGFLDWTLERVELKRNNNFSVDTTSLESVRQLQLLQAQDSLVQFNSIITFTIQRDMTNDVFSPSKGFFHSLTLEESGLLPSVLRPNLPFTQFLRASALGRWYVDLTDRRYSVFALKLRGGIEGKYGGSGADPTRGIPQAYRFYGGGGGSIRGWKARDLSATGNPELGGNLVFEASMEIRTNVFQSARDDLLDKIWTVAFVDVGNVWAQTKNLQLKSIAMAAGIGLRYDTFFGPFRIDYGFRVYNPLGDAAGKRWITERSFFGQTFKEGIFHFGIGHSF